MLRFELILNSSRSAQAKFIHYLRHRAGLDNQRLTSKKITLHNLSLLWPGTVSMQVCEILLYVIENRMIFLSHTNKWGQSKNQKI